jgi:hypothetical protein
MLKKFFGTLFGKRKLEERLEVLEDYIDILQERNAILEMRNKYLSDDLIEFQKMSTKDSLLYTAQSIKENLDEGLSCSNHVIRVIDENTVEVRSIGVDACECWCDSPAVKRISIS